MSDIIYIDSFFNACNEAVDANLLNELWSAAD